MSKGFLDIQIGDVVICYDEYSHDYIEHVLEINYFEDDEEYATETNPLGRRFWGIDQDYINEDGEFEEGDDDYLTIVDEGNFVGFIK